MPLFARRLVSKKKRRLQRGDFELDLSYIWPATDDAGLPADGAPGRLITMGFPSENGSAGEERTYTMSQQEVQAHALAGLDAGDGKRTARQGGSSVDEWFRNPMDRVQGFLETFHAGHYKVFNFCCERWYDHAKFHGRVSRYPFADHNCPPPAMIHACCTDAASWLSADPQNVVAFHCKAGKGRAGMMTVCLLLHMRWVDTAAEALEHYGRMRTHDGKGVTIPSQRRYVEYYALLLSALRAKARAAAPDASLRFPLPSPALRLRAVAMGPFARYATYVRDRWGGGGAEGMPTIRIERQGGDVWDSSEAQVSEAGFHVTADSWRLEMPSGPVIAGDVCLMLHPWAGSPTAKRPKHKAAFWLHTGMLDPENPECLQCEIGHTTIEMLEISGSGSDEHAAAFRVCIAQKGLDAAHSKDWAAEDFCVTLELEILAEEEPLCWDGPQEGLPPELADSPRREPPAKARACCGARPPSHGAAKGNRRPGLRAEGEPEPEAEIEAGVAPEPEPEPEPEKA